MLLVYGQTQLGPTIATLHLEVKVIETHWQKYIYDCRKGKGLSAINHLQAGSDLAVVCSGSQIAKWKCAPILTNPDFRAEILDSCLPSWC